MSSRVVTCLLAVAVATAGLVDVGLVVHAGRSSGTTLAADTRPATTETRPPPEAPAATSRPAPPARHRFTSYDAWTGAPVATVWVKPHWTRPVDAPILRRHPDVARWITRQSLAQREDLDRRVMTQTLHGERVEVVGRRGGWSKVRLPEQRGSYFRTGIVGWVRADHLTDHRPRATDPLLRTFARPSGDTAVRLGRTFLGVRYLWGGMSRRGIDCSGLTYVVMRQLGRILPRDAADQARVGRPVSRAALRPGDLVFFGPGGWRTVHHVGIYAGGGLVLHAPHTGTEVQLTPLSAWSDYWGARRLL